MRSWILCALGRAVGVLVVCSSPLAQAQSTNAVQPASSDHAVLVQVAPPIYPAIARTARIGGDVQIRVAVRPDGSVESATAISGDPQLIPHALDSAKQSRFDCSTCNRAVSVQLITYTFKVATQTDRCCCSGPEMHKRYGSTPAPEVPYMVHTQDHITITAPPLCTCPDLCSSAWDQEHSRYRSAKCLFLWKCGHRKFLGAEAHVFTPASEPMAWWRILSVDAIAVPAIASKCFLAAPNLMNNSSASAHNKSLTANVPTVPISMLESVLVL